MNFPTWVLPLARLLTRGEDPIVRQPCLVQGGMSANKAIPALAVLVLCVGCGGTTPSSLTLKVRQQIKAVQREVSAPVKIPTDLPGQYVLMKVSTIAPGAAGKATVTSSSPSTPTVSPAAPPSHRYAYLQYGLKSPVGVSGTPILITEGKGAGRLGTTRMVTVAGQPVQWETEPPSMILALWNAPSGVSVEVEAIGVHEATITSVMANLIHAYGY